MPLLGLLPGRVDLKSLALKLQDADPVRKTEELALHYGSLLQSVVDSLIIAASIFLIFKVLERFKRKQEAAPAAAAPAKSKELLTEIRDLLRENKDR